MCIFFLRELIFTYLKLSKVYNPICLCETLKTHYCGNHSRSTSKHPLNLHYIKPFTPIVQLRGLKCVTIIIITILNIFFVIVYCSKCIWFIWHLSKKDTVYGFGLMVFKVYVRFRVSGRWFKSQVGKWCRVCEFDV